MYMYEEIKLTYHSSGCHVASCDTVQCQSVHRCWCGGHIGVRSGGHGGSGQHDGEGEGGHHDTGGQEVCQLSAGVAGAVVTVSPGQQGGDGAEEVEHDHGEGIPVAEENNIIKTHLIKYASELLTHTEEGHRQGTGTTIR